QAFGGQLFHRIHQQVGKDLFKLSPVGLNRLGRLRTTEGHLNLPGFYLRRKDLKGILQYLIQTYIILNQAAAIGNMH
ncbi:MAG: hypothetical protein J0653_02495, partial [Deltaproteobacteria bacterium]|nr:hypothetical protein [Deltaproteobacteria bacterium]